MTSPLTLAEAASQYREALRVLRERRSGDVPIYFIQAGTHGPIKIGIAHDPPERLGTLQVGNPAKLRLLGVYWAPQFVEKQIHADLAADRIRGEWFKPTRAVLAEVEGLAERWDPHEWDDWDGSEDFWR